MPGTNTSNSMDSSVSNKKKASLPRDLRLAKLAEQAREMGLRWRSPVIKWRAVDLYEQAALEAERNDDMKAAMWFQAEAVNFASILRNTGVARPERAASSEEDNA
jgi:hypothetical protein